MNVQLPANLPNIDEIEAGANRSVELYVAAFAKIAEAQEAIQAAYAAIEAVTPGAEFHDSRDAQEVQEFHKAVRMPDKDTYLRVARKLVNVRCWHYVADRCGLHQLMDAQAKRELDEQLRYVPERPRHGREMIDNGEAAKGPPPFTAENVHATLAAFTGQAQTIWRRGIANAFSSLDRRFRSHDGFKVGSRIILTRLASADYGRIDSYGRRADTFRDVERTFHILDGRDPRHARSDFLHQIHGERKWGVHQSEHENDYLKVRIFQNGNAHLWFKRADLVNLVNLELAAYYGEVIGDGQTKEADPFENRALTPAKLFGFYPTPGELADKIVAQIPFRNGTQRILEPSAGTGNLAFRATKAVKIHGETSTRRVDAIEMQPNLAGVLRSSGKLSHVTTGDFLRMPPTSIYDGVIMNPPFDRERDIDHVTHALKFLKPDGWLMSIMSAGIEYRETRKSAAFRKLVADRKGWIIELPSGSFAEVGTNVNTVLVGFGLRKPWF